MKDERSIYINRILNYYRKSVFEDVDVIPVAYIPENDNKPKVICFGHNEGLDAIQNYIKDLEKKIDELQYIERIIQAATRLERKQEDDICNTQTN